METPRRDLPTTGQGQCSADEIQAAHKRKEMLGLAKSQRKRAPKPQWSTVLSFVYQIGRAESLRPGVGEGSGKRALCSTPGGLAESAVIPWQDTWYEGPRTVPPCIWAMLYVWCFKEVTEQMHKDAWSRMCIHQHSTLAKTGEKVTLQRGLAK